MKSLKPIWLALIYFVCLFSNKINYSWIIKCNDSVVIIHNKFSRYYNSLY